MKSRFTLVTLLLIAFAFSGCNFEVDEEDHHTAMGEIGELAVFSDPRTLGELNTEIKNCLAPKITGMFSPERSYKLRIAKEGILKGYHKKNYVLFILVHSDNWSEIQGQIDKKFYPVIEKYMSSKRDTSFIIPDPWAFPQKVVFVISKNRETMKNFLITKKEGLFETALQAERQTTVSRLLRKKASTDAFYADMMRTRNFAYRMPYQYSVTVKSDTFIGFKRYVSDKEIGVYSYFEEYTSQDQFTKEYIIQKRNQVMKRHYHGPDHPEGLPTYLSTENEENVPISVRETSINGQYAIETRGWYTMVNYKYGGPFVSYSIYSKKLNRVVTIEGLVHAPNRKVAKYLREVELIANTYTE
jgi:hypothetical protein